MTTTTFLDATPLIHGERAVRRNTTNLYRHLLREPPVSDYVFPYFTGRRGARLDLENAKAVTPIHWPGRLLQPMWRHLGWPSIEDLAGECDLYYSPDMIFPPARRAKVLSTIRGTHWYEIPEQFDRATLDWMLTMHAYALRHSTHWLAVSENTKLAMLQHDKVESDRIFVVSHGVDPAFRRLPVEDSRKTVREQFGLQKPYLLYVGVLAKHKNITGLLKMFAHLRSEHPDLDLVLAGPAGSATEDLKAGLVNAELAGRIHWVGPVASDSPSLVALYNAAEVVVHLSHYEGWCAIPLEAMACGTPVVLADIPSLREVGAEAASYVPIGDSEQAAKAAVRLMEDSTYRQERIQVGFNVVRRHSWTNTAKKFSQVVRRILTE